jgi:SHS2 domain-containing protein
VGNYWRHYEHRSDIGIIAVGKTRQDALRQAGLAMTAAMVDLKHVKPEKEIDIEIPVKSDDKQLLFDWLNAVIYEMSVRNMVFCDFDILIRENKLTAKMRGEKIDKNRHKPAVEIKAATYSGLKMEKKTNRRWAAQCIIYV